jgi:hypothetical protein
MKIIATYRMYYGEDFLQRSLASIYDYMDEIIIFWTDRPWGNVREAKYKGEIVTIPIPVDNAARIAKLLMETVYPKIKMIYNDYPTSENLLTELYNTYIENDDNKEGNVVLFMEPDMLFDKKGITSLIKYIKKNRFTNVCTRQYEFWKTHEYVVTQRNRAGVICFDLRDRIYMPKTGKNCAPYEDCPFIDIYTYNFGYCLSPKNMYWKIIVTLAFTTVVHDSLPDENWYEDTWIKWDYETNNKNLEISKFYRHYLPRADKYNGPLPETYLKSIKNVR